LLIVDGAGAGRPTLGPAGATAAHNDFGTLCDMGCSSKMIRTIIEREPRNDSAAVLREVESGRTLIVTRNGTPVSELRPLGPHPFAPRATIAHAAERRGIG
jgi:antitoxin (DNA-binding transcriptional repressor) of toxin-antitoxin stability system